MFQLPAHQCAPTDWYEVKLNLKPQGLQKREPELEQKLELKLELEQKLELKLAGSN